MAAQWYFQSAAKAKAEQRDYPRFTHGFDSGNYPQALVEQGVRAAHALYAFRQLLQVHPDREVGEAFSCEHDRANAVVCGDFIDQYLQLIDKIQRHTVQGRIIDGDDCDGVLAFQ